MNYLIFYWLYFLSYIDIYKKSFLGANKKEILFIINNLFKISKFNALAVTL